MRKLVASAVMAVAVVTAGAGVLGVQSRASADNPSSIVGAWEVTAAAPFPAHLFTFNRDGTMISTNPTDVQVNRSNTNDSVGLGEWKAVNGDNGDHYIEGTFEELNAFADTHQQAPTLTVSFKIKLADNGQTFDGPAVATLIGVETDQSHLTGTKRITIDQDAVDSLHF
ncbi:MAG TPA: hypothetical protein VLF69_06445 [Candidatus Saccharimonadales bacterium]|nr:hypothetical protein [Candidatus Saccharimonadales bacterium]